ncbi:MAG: hypothetical protein JSW46_09965, partial [Gemmatimonadota bacterium]
AAMSRLKRLIAEVHERSLWQALVVYLGASLGVLGTVDLFIEYLGLPRWLMWLAFALLVTGLPVVIVTSLAKEEVYGDEVPEEYAEAAALEDRRLRFLTWRTAGFALVGVLAVWGLVAAGWVVLGGTGYLLFRGAAAGFVEREDCVVVAKFENETEDAALGFAVREAVITDISQTSYVTVLGDERLSPTLGLMRLPDTTRVDQRLAVEIASRQNCPAVVSGTVARLGTGYSLTAAIIETEAGAEVARLRETAADETEVIGVVGQLARLVRRHLGESLASIRRSEPLARVTTSSLEALKFYSRAVSGPFQHGDMPGAIALLEQAVALDTAFAMAYRKLGVAYGNAGQDDESYRRIGLAYQFSERLPPRERLQVVALYHHQALNRLDVAVNYYRIGLESYPKPDVWRHNLALAYSQQYRFEEALEVWLEMDWESPDVWFRTPLDAAKDAGALGRHGLADSALAVMREKLPTGHPELVRTAAWNAYYAGDLVLADSLAREMERDPRSAVDGRWLRAGLATMSGRMNEAFALAPRLLSPGVLRFIQAASFAAGMPERALSSVDSARSRLTLGTGRPVYEHWRVGVIAGGYALAGDAQSARELLALADSLAQNDDFHPTGIGESVLGVIALQEGRAEDALGHFARAKAANYGRYSWEERALLADAHAALGNFYEAIAQYDTLTGTYRLHWLDLELSGPLRPLAHERLGSLYLEVGDTVAAARHLTEFIEFWNDADPELQPRVESARRLLAQLAAEETEQP